MGAMRAIKQYRFGPPEVLQISELPDLSPGPGQLLVDVTAAGVHLLDTKIRAGETAGPMGLPELPMVPGREVSGIVGAIGAGVSSAWLGQRVVAHLGMASGGYAEQAVVPAERAYRIPDGLGFEEAVAAIGTGRTAAGILDQAPIRPDDVVVVTAAAGGLGVLLVQAARGAGAHVTGLAGGPAKAHLVGSLGADKSVDYLAEGWIDHLTAPTLVFDSVGGPVGHELYARLVPGGRLVRYGWSAGQQNDYADPRRPVLDVLGPAIMNNLARLERDALAAAADGSRVPLVTTYGLGEAAQAHCALESRGTTGKVVLLTAE